MDQVQRLVHDGVTFSARTYGQDLSRPRVGRSDSFGPNQRSSIMHLNISDTTTSTSPPLLAFGIPTRWVGSYCALQERGGLSALLALKAARGIASCLCINAITAVFSLHADGSFVHVRARHTSGYWIQLRIHGDQTPSFPTGNCGAILTPPVH